MINASPANGLDEIATSQAHKEATHNRMLYQCDALCPVIDAIRSDLSAAPGSPTKADTYIVAATPSAGDPWFGWTGRVAYWNDDANYDGVADAGEWMSHIPQEGWLAWDVNAGAYKVATSATTWAAGPT